MACPFFDPLEPWPLDSWPGPARVPLGRPWRGRCVAPDGEFDPPGETVQREFCNFGNARGRCSRFPGDASAEAHRFSCSAMRGTRDFQEIWIEERECTPLRHVALDIACACGRPDPGASLPMRQAQAFALACSDEFAAASALQVHLRKPNE